MKKLQKVTTALLCGCVVMSSFAACGGEGGMFGGGTKLDPAKTLYIANYDGAAGHTWLDYYAKEYKKIEPEITISVMNKKEEFSGDTVKATMPNDVYDIYFTDHSDYHSFVAGGVLADMTDTVTENVYDDNGELVEEGATGTKSIVDFLYPEMREYYAKTSGETTKYYALPVFYPISGIVYDADLFNEKKWFFDKDGEIGVTNTDPNVGFGPDGDLSTTADNGEPQTWKQFLTLLASIRGSGNVTPFTWSGTYIYQRQYFLEAVRVAYEGKNDSNLWYTLNGVDNTLGEINEENGWKLVEQEGTKKMLQAAKDIVSNSDNYSNNAFLVGTQTHTAAQEEFVYSIHTNDRIAMFLESSYWENEARGVFSDMEEIQKSWGYGKRNFRLMNMPKMDGSDNEKQTYYGDASTKFVAINARSKKLDMAKKFIQFIHSRKNLAAFTTISGTFRPFDYTITEEERATATPFMQNLMEKVLHPNSEVVIAENYSNYVRYRDDDNRIMKAKINGEESYEPMAYFKDHPTLTIDNYYSGISALNKEGDWKTSYGNYKKNLD